MRSRNNTLIVAAITLLATGLPLMAALDLADRESTSEASEQTQLVAGEVLAREERMADQVTAAYDRMRALTTPPCSEAGRQQLVAIALDYSYVKAVGYIIDGRVACSSFAPKDDGSRLEPSAYTSTLGVRVTPKADLGTGKRFLVLEKSGYVVALLPEVLLDIPLDQAHISSGALGRSAWLRIAGSGPFDPAWRERLGRAHQVTFSDNGNLVTIRASTRYDLASYSSMPMSFVQSRVIAFALVLVPIGLLLGGAAAVAILYLVRQRTSLPALLRSAIKKREFVLHYQPIVELASGRMVGAEALLRWPRHDGSQVMRPDAFIPAAEDCGLIRNLTAYVLERVAAEGPAFVSRYPDGYISINLSPSDLHEQHILDQLRQLIGTHGITARNLVVEITEHSFLDPKHARENITAIRALGIRVAIDDFGTGFSSLSHLATLKTDYLKIDKVFVDTIGTDSATSEVALHIVQIAHSLDLTVIAEGIESQLQVDFLREHGVKYGQGWLFSKARPMEILLRVQSAD